MELNNFRLNLNKISYITLTEYFRTRFINFQDFEC